MVTEMKRRDDEVKTQMIELERVRQEAADDRLAARQEADVRFQAEATERIQIEELSRREAEERYQVAEALRRVPKMEKGEDITNFLECFEQSLEVGHTIGSSCRACACGKIIYRNHFSFSFI